MVALIGNFDFTELLVIAAVALIAFGKRLPEVGMRAASQLMRLRRSMSKLWREAGVEDELRRVRREIERDMPDVPNPVQALHEKRHDIGRRLDPRRVVRDALQGAEVEPEAADSEGAVPRDPGSAASSEVPEPSEKPGPDPDRESA